MAFRRSASAEHGQRKCQHLVQAFDSELENKAARIMRVPGFSAWDQSDAFEPEKGATSPSDRHARNAIASLLGCDPCQVNTTWDSPCLRSTPHLYLESYAAHHVFEWVSGQDFLRANLPGVGTC